MNPHDSVTATVEYFRRPVMVAGVNFCLLPHVGARPTVFQSEAALCRHLHGLRDGVAIQLVDQLLHVRPQPDPLKVVAVYTLDDAGERHRLLGLAYLQGRPWRALQAALYAVEPNPTARAEAA